MKRFVWCSALMVALVDAGASAAIVCAQAPAVRVLSQTAATSMKAVKDGQAVDVEKRSARIAVRLPNGKEIPADVVMVREPQSGLYFWMFLRAAENAPAPATEPALDFFLYFTGDSAVGFTFVSPFLFIREIHGRVPDLAAAERTAVAEITKHTSAIQEGSMEWAREINMVPHVGRDFLNLAGSAAPGSATVTAVSRSGGQWDVTLRGPNRDTARVTLDDKYSVVAVRRQPADRE
jgi:hypothetical protein